jgi:hypothetical protein
VIGARYGYRTRAIQYFGCTHDCHAYLYLCSLCSQDWGEAAARKEPRRRSAGQIGSATRDQNRSIPISRGRRKVENPPSGAAISTRCAVVPQLPPCLDEEYLARALNPPTRMMALIAPIPTTSSVCEGIAEHLRKGRCIGRRRSHRQARCGLARDDADGPRNPARSQKGGFLEAPSSALSTSPVAATTSSTQILHGLKARLMDPSLFEEF